jgi:hypothetical protein
MAKCPKCRAVVDEGLDRCTFCGHYFQGSAMEDYKLDEYDPTAGYNPKQTVQPMVSTKPKTKFRFKLKK